MKIPVSHISSTVKKIVKRRRREVANFYMSDAASAASLGRDVNPTIETAGRCNSVSVAIVALDVNGVWECNAISGKSIDFDSFGQDFSRCPVDVRIDV
jgi:hypothetical protein